MSNESFRLLCSISALEELRKKPAGTLRLSVSSVAESFLSGQLIAEFLAENPEIKLDVAVDGGKVRLRARPVK